MNDKPEIEWQIEMSGLPGDEPHHRITARFKGQDWDGEGTFEIWLEGHDGAKDARDHVGWESGVTLARDQATKLHAFLGAWLGALGP